MHTLIIHIMGKWWQMVASPTLKHTSPLSVGPNLPTQLMMSCNVVYDLTEKVMIKNRHSNSDNLSDAVIMKIWLEEGLPVFKWNGYKQFRRELTKYHEAPNNE